MGQCFVPDCNHQSESHTCSFYRFPNARKIRQRWIKQIRRADREPSTSSRVCSCHFPNGKEGGPKLFQRNANKLFQSAECPMRNVKKHKVNDGASTSACSSVPISISSPSNMTTDEQSSLKVDNVILTLQLEEATKELNDLKQKKLYKGEKYSVDSLTDEVICMESGLPNKRVFAIVADYVRRFQDSIVYYSGWKVEAISLDDQIFITLMKLRQNYTSLHIAQLFHCSTATVSNIVITFIHVLYKLLYEDGMKTVPSREKNKTSMPDSFQLFGNCRMVMDCTDIEIAAPGLMSDQKQTYSVYRGIHSFKFLLGVVPNAVITYCSKLFPGSASDKAIVKESGMLAYFVTGDLILADKGFLIQDIVPEGVSVNVPPFLNRGKFSESEVRLTKSIAKCRIHVERANARLKDFKVLGFIPPYLRCYAEKLVKLCCALVNLQHSLIREIRETIELD